jgi:hypothetical protein
MKVLIVHLSDIHLQARENSVTAKFPLIAKALQNEEVALDGVIVVVSGDIAYSGQSEEYKVAAEWLGIVRDELAEKTGVKDVQFVFVPGNHDCDFKKGGNARETIISAMRKGISAPVDEGTVELCCAVQHDFFAFRDSFRGATPTRSEGRIYWEYLWQKEDTKVLFRCYNTAWLSQLHEQQGGLFFPETYLTDSESRIIKADYYTAVFHHPYNWFPAATFRQFRNHVEKVSDLILTGHELVEGRDLLKVLGGKRRLLIFGRQQAGKTTLAKVLFRDFYNKGITPVLISGEDITQTQVKLENFENLVETRFQQQYRNPMLPTFQQLDRDKTLVIIDDFDHTRLNSKGRLRLLDNIHTRYERVFILADDVIKLEEIASGKESCEVLADYGQFELVQFGYLLRSKLIEQWYSIGSEYVANPEELAKKIHSAENLITSLLGHNYLPSFPVFILSLLQAYESGSQLDSSVGTYGGLYEVLISQALATKWRGANLDLKKTYLSELAYWMFSRQKRRVTDEDWMRFHAEYCAKYKIKPSREGLKGEFNETGLFDELDGRFGFRHSYSYYYFVARHFRDNIAQPAIRSVLESLCGQIHKQENASIWLFLTHLSKDPFIVDVILNHARKVFSKFSPASFQGEVAILEEFARNIEEVVLQDTEFGEIKEQRLRQLDAAPSLPEETGNELAGGEVETNEALKLIAELTIALRTLEVLGQIVKNFPGSLIGADKYALVKECYELGLRTVSMILDVFKNTSEGFIEGVVERIIEDHPSLKERRNRAELEKNLKGFVFWMVENCCFSLIKRISHAVGHSQLNETYQEVRETMDTNAVSLIHASVHLDNTGIPEDLLEDLARRFRGNVFCERLLRQVVVQHFYLFQTRETTKQRVCSLLSIPIRKLKGLDSRATHEKFDPPKP